MNDQFEHHVRCEEQIERDYQENEVPAIHRIGRITLLVGCLLMYIPGIFMYVVMKWDAIPFSEVLAFAMFFLPMAGPAQFVEHLQFYPLMGAAATYMGYLSGNASGMRLPVASSCAATFNEDVLSAKGQIAAVVGVAVSVVANIAVLGIIIVFGKTILQILPSVVTDAMNYITVALFGYLLCLNLRGLGKGDMKKGISSVWPWVGVAIIGKIVFQKWMQSSMYIILTLLLAVALGYLLECQKRQSQN